MAQSSAGAANGATPTFKDNLVAMTKKQFWTILERLDHAGLLDGIVDDDGTVHPTQTAIAYVEKVYPKDSPEQKRLRAQAQTLIDHAKKYRIELN